MEISTQEQKEAENWFLEMLSKAEQAGEPVSQFMEITPAKAAVLLDSNDCNRKIKPAKLIQLETDMRHGRFRINGETIIVSKDGKLNDGQHRLTAILNTGIKQIINMVFGVERESRFTVDIGAARTVGDALGLKGLVYGNTIAATARRVLSFEHFNTVNQTGRISNAEAMERAETDKLLKEVAEWAHVHQSKFRPFNIRASEIATAFYLLASKHPKYGLAFMTAVRDGLMLPPGSPIHALRQKLMMYPKLNLAQKIELIIKAWNYWIRDERIEKYLVTGKIPEIKGPKKNES